jgi:hypothetical protein
MKVEYLVSLVVEMGIGVGAVIALSWFYDRKAGKHGE